MRVAFHIFFSKNISVYAIFNDQRFNNTLLTTSLVLKSEPWSFVMNESIPGIFENLHEGR